MAGDEFPAFLPREQPVKAVVNLVELLFQVGDEAGRIEIGKILRRLFRPVIDGAAQIDLFVFEDLQKVFVNGDRPHPLQLQHGGKFVDKVVESVAGRQNEHVARADLLVIVHQIAEAMEHDHRLSAARTSLQNKIFPLRTGDDLVLLFLNGLDDVADGGLLLAVSDDFAQIRVEEYLLVPAADLLGRQIVPHGEKFVLEIEDPPLLGPERPAQNRLIIVLIDGKGDAALLVISARQRRPPIDDLQADVPLFSDIIAVVALRGVGEIHAREIRFVEKAPEGIYRPFVRLDFPEQLARFPIAFRVVLLLRLDAGDLLFRLPDLQAVLPDVGDAEHAHDGLHMPVLVRLLFFGVEQSEKPFLIRLLVRVERPFQFFVSRGVPHNYSCMTPFIIPHFLAKGNTFSENFLKNFVKTDERPPKKSERRSSEEIYTAVYIFSGMPMPSSAKAFFRVCRVAAVSARRKFFVSSSSAPRILQSK